MSNTTTVKNIIVGAGPAGIQLAYFFEKAGIEYIILERNMLAGSFFDRYPLSGQLISINKRHTGSDDPEFNMRHDWNSLLSDDGPKFTEYSTEYYPDRKDLVRYINDFASKYSMKINYSHSVNKIRKASWGYMLSVTGPDSEQKFYKCERLIIATGMGIPNKSGIIDKTKRPIKHYAEYEKDYFKNKENLKQFENKTVAIIGNGNSGYELGNLLTPICSNINIIGRRYKPASMSTHYAGDLRSIYYPFIDTFLLKSLNAIGVIDAPTLIIEQETPESIYKLSSDCGFCSNVHQHSLESISGFDHVILCTGWAFDTTIFDFQLEPTIRNKYPKLTHAYESTNNTNLFFIGSLMHSHDYKKSSGGFIHGFRYLIEYFFHINYDRKFKLRTFKSDALTSIVEYILHRLNSSSALYQMFGQLLDVFILNKNNNEILYINDVRHSFLESKSANTNLVYFTLSLEFSNEPPETDIIKLLTKQSMLGKESKARLLHPVLRVYKDTADKLKDMIDEIHFDEDIFARFIGSRLYTDKLTRALKMFF